MKLGNLSNKHAFTIVELLVVIVVIGILAAITVVSYTDISQKAVVSSLQSDLNNASKLLKMDQVINSAYPATLAAANGGKGIPSSPDTTYQYVVNNNSNPQIFCVTANKGTTSYKITNDDIPILGTCQTPGMVTDGLILNLDAGNTVSYPGTGTVWNDLSGLGNNANILGTSTWTISDSGKFDFGNIGQITQYIRLPHTAAQSTAANYTLEFWMQPITASYTYFSSMASTSTDNYYIMEQNNNTIRSFTASITIPYVSNNIIQFVVVRSGSDMGLIYKNSIPTSTNGITLINGVAPNGWILNQEQDSIGGNFSTSQNYRGAFMIVRLYNRALSQSEITQNFNNLRDRYGL